MEPKVFIAKCNVGTEKVHWFYTLDKCNNKIEARRKGWMCPTCILKQGQDEACDRKGEGIEEEGKKEKKRITMVEKVKKKRMRRVDK